MNSLTGYLNGVPQISTRDTQTSVHLRDNETLVIGGLIQEGLQRTESKIPGLGDIPLVGRIFRNDQTTTTRNELIIVVTPHILPRSGGEQNPSPGTSPSGVPAARPLPTLPPTQSFPSAAVKSDLSARTRVPSAGDSPTRTLPVALTPPTPAPTPNAFAQANTFIFGAPPQSTFAGNSDAPQLFYAMLQPTVLSRNSLIRIDAITTTNVQKVTLAAGSANLSLSPIGPGTWRGEISANSLGLLPSAALQLTLAAARGDGQSTSIVIPISMLP